MKKYLFLILFFGCLFISGCGNNNQDIIKDLKKQINDLKAYDMTGKLEVVNNDDVFNYNVSVSYKDSDYYRVALQNIANNHEQIILRNDDGVYVMTHKSMQFF